MVNNAYGCKIDEIQERKKNIIINSSQTNSSNNLSNS